DRDDLQVVQSRKLFKLRQAGHCAVVVHYFADDACRSESRDAGYIDACFGLSGTNENASAPSAQRKSMAGSRQVRRSGLLVDCRKNSRCAIGGRDSRSNAALSLDAYGEGRAVTGGVLRGHKRQLQFIATLFGKTETDQTATVFGHEVDRLRRDLLRSADQI